VLGALAIAGDDARDQPDAALPQLGVPREQASDEADVSIRVISGPEVLAGSTRLKAGTATKLVLNMISTLAMARIGKVHGNRMVDVNTRGKVKLGIVMARTGLSREAAQARLDAAGGFLRRALER
jgi:N-acetylmuramic acid 6-phosphate etherase